jgi:K+-transporting ATPase ATPase C chain
MLRAPLITSLRLLLVATALALAYGVVSTAVARVVFPTEAQGSRLSVDGRVVGSRLVGQLFSDARHFHSRTSAAEYDGSASGTMNLGPDNPELLATIAERASAYRELNGLDSTVDVPIDAVTASASGLDPHISIANARLQAPRVARANGLDVEDVLQAMRDATDRPALGAGEDGVNVLELNIAIDEMASG